MIAPEYVAARRTLLDALDALRAHHDNLVLIGAQAVYLHTGSTRLVEPVMTTDADLAIETSGLRDEPEIGFALAAAGFVVGQPGHWIGTNEVAVDLMVAPHQSNRSKTNARAARLPPHASATARIGPGLAAALTDNSSRRIESFESTDTRAHTIRVAGPAALLVAKAIKIEDRLSQAAQGKPGRIVDKDALDMFRLLQAVETADLCAGLRSHPPGSPAAEDVLRALSVLARHAGEVSSAFPSLAATAAPGDPAVASSFVELAQDLLHAMI